MKLSLITNRLDLAIRAENLGIDRIFIDLEKRGKSERQSGRNLFLADHSLLDVKSIRPSLHRSKLLVRVDPLHEGSKSQIEQVIDAGADLVMLPYFNQFEEADEFISMVGGRALPVLLVETRASANILEKLTLLPGLSEIHIGLNDLSISYRKNSIFELIYDGTIDELCSILRRSCIPFGFGGIGSLSRIDLPVPPELFLAEQIYQGATRGWLGRTFRETEPPLLDSNYKALRKAIDRLYLVDADEKAKLSKFFRLHLEAILKKSLTLTTRNSFQKE